MSLVEQPSIKESSLLSSDLSEAGGGALSAECKGKVSELQCHVVQLELIVWCTSVSVNTEGAELRCHTATSHQGQNSCSNPLFSTSAALEPVGRFRVHVNSDTTVNVSGKELVIGLHGNLEF